MDVIVLVKNGDYLTVLSYVKETGSDTAKIVRSDTGEVIGMIQSQEGISFIEITTKKKRDKDSKRDSDKRYLSMPSFGVTNFDAIEKISRLKLSSSELTIFLLIQSKVDFENNLARKNKKKILSAGDIADMLNFDIRTVNKALDKLIDLEVIFVVVEHIYFNPFICHKGSTVDSTLLDMFGCSSWNKYASVGDT